MRIYLIATIYVAAPLLIMYLFQRYRFFSKIGTVLLAYALGIVLALSGFMKLPQEQTAALSTLQEWMMNLTVPIAIPLMLFSSHFVLWFKTLKKTMATLAAGIVSILLTVTIAYLLFRSSDIPELWKSCGLLVGMYTGGTLNFVSLKTALKVPEDTYVLVQTFEMALTFFFLLFILSGGYKLFRKILPHNSGEQSTNKVEVKETFEDYSGMFKKGTFGKLLLALALAIGCLALGAGLSMAVGAGLNELIIILTITTLAIAASFVKKIREIPKTFEFGMYFILVFSIVIASMFDIHALFSRTSLNIMGMIAFILVFSVLLHLLFAKIFKVEADLFTVSHIALLFSPPFVPPVAAAMNNRKVLVNGIVIGLIGYALGTYLGVLLAEILKWIG